MIISKKSATFLQIGSRPGFTQVFGNEWPKIQNPPVDQFIADLLFAISQEILDIPDVPGEPKIKPNSMPDHIGRKSLACMEDELHGPHERMRGLIVR